MPEVQQSFEALPQNSSRLLRSLLFKVANLNLLGTKTGICITFIAQIQLTKDIMERGHRERHPQNGLQVICSSNAKCCPVR